MLPKDKGLYEIEGDSVKKVVVKADMVSNDSDYSIIPSSTIEASFKGSNTSNVTYMNYMFDYCDSLLTSLDVSNFDTSKVTSMSYMFSGCGKLRTIRMIGCSTSTIDKIRGVKPSSAQIVTE